MIKAIIFDVGGVITFTDFDALFANFAKRIGLPMDFFDTYYHPKFKDMLVGKIHLQILWEEMKKQVTDKGLDYTSVWLEEATKVRKVNDQLLEVIDGLRKTYKMGILSNLTPTRGVIDEDMDLYSHFDFTVLSFKEGVRKPDPKIYEIAISRSGVKADEILFIDDNKGMTKAASAMGIKTIVYKDNQQLFLDLNTAGVL